MMRVIVFFIFLITFVRVTKAGVTDLELDLDIPDTSQLSYGQIVPFSLTITNHGPDAAAASSISFLPNTVFITGDVYYNSVGYPQVLISRDMSIKQECLFFILSGSPPPPPHPPPSISYIADMPIIPANSSITCYGKAQNFIEEQSIELNFFVAPFYTDTDPNLSNNTTNVVFGLKPKAIPSLNLYGLLAMILLILFVVKPKLNNTQV